MKGLIRTIIILFGLGLSACQSSNPMIEGKTHEYLLNQKCPTLLVMKVGETLKFSVTENPSTGYQWQLVQPLKIFKTEESFLTHDVAEGAVGIGGTKIFKFKAEKPGQDLIELVHVRSWESSKQPDQQWLCRIRVS